MGLGERQVHEATNREHESMLVVMDVLNVDCVDATVLIVKCRDVTTANW